MGIKHQNPICLYIIGGKFIKNLKLIQIVIQSPMIMFLQYFYLSLVLSILRMKSESIELDPNCHIPSNKKSCQKTPVFKLFNKLTPQGPIITRKQFNSLVECNLFCGLTSDCYSFSWLQKMCNIYKNTPISGFKSSNAHIYVLLCCTNSITTGNYYKMIHR